LHERRLNVIWLSEFVRAGVCYIFMPSLPYQLKNISPCKGCYGCSKKPIGNCVTNDQMAEIYPKIIAADVLIHACPVYFFTMNGTMKCYLERFTPLFVTPEWTPRPEAGFDKKRAINVITSGAPECGEMAAIPFRETYKFTGIKLIGEVMATSENIDSKLEEAKQLGLKI